MIITNVNISMEVTTKHQQQMEDSDTFFSLSATKQSANRLEWMAVECCNGFGPFSQLNIASLTIETSLRFYTWTII